MNALASGDPGHSSRKGVQAPLANRPRYGPGTVAQQGETGPENEAAENRGSERARLGVEIDHPQDPEEAECRYRRGTGA